MPQHALLDNVTHKDLRVRTGFGPEFGDNINQVLVFPTEFGELHREYPIFFRQDAEGRFQCIVLLGLDRDENLFLDGRHWQARYVPAIHARGPFLIGLTKDGEDGPQAMIQVDLEHPRIATDGEGVAVFKPQGGQSAYLDGVSDALRRIHEGIGLAPAMFEAFSEAGIIEPVQLDISITDAERYTVPDLFTVSEERLASLDAAALDALNQSGFLGSAYLVAASIGNVNRLIDLKHLRREAA